jgi:hypothetical protein
MNLIYTILISTMISVTCSFSQVISIAEAREDLDGDYIPDRLGDTVTVQGVIYTPNFAPGFNHYYIDDGTAGIHLFMPGPKEFNWELGDETQFTGEVYHFFGATEIVASDTLSWFLLSTGNPTPDPVSLTIGEYLSDPESFEGLLIELLSVTMVGGNWPNPGQNALIQISDGLDTLDIQIDRHTDVSYNPEPVWPCDVRGVGCQNTTSTPPNDGYQLLPRFYSDFLSISGLGETQTEILANFEISQNYPNPFNPVTKIQYLIPEQSNVAFKVYDILGNEVATLVNEEKLAGTYEITLYADGLSSGVYFYQLKAGDFIQTKKMILLK